MKLRRLVQYFSDYRTAVQYSDPIVESFRQQYGRYWGWMAGMNLVMSLSIPFWSEASKGILFINSCFLMGQLGFNIKNYLIPNDPLRQKMFVDRESAKRTLFLELMMSGLTVSLLSSNLIFPSYGLVLVWYLIHVHGNFTHCFALVSQTTLGIAFLVALYWDWRVKKENQSLNENQRMMDELLE